MNTTIAEIVEALRANTDIPPRTLVEFHSWCVGEYSYLAAKLEQAVNNKPTEWLLLRDESKSVSETDRKWQATPQGMEEGKLRRQMKVLEKIMSSLRLRLMIKDQEARNIM